MPSEWISLNDHRTDNCVPGSGSSSASVAPLTAVIATIAAVLEVEVDPADRRHVCELPTVGDGPGVTRLPSAHAGHVWRNARVNHVPTRTRMSQIEGIVKERYTSDEISADLSALQNAGLLDDDALEQVAREFYFRGLVHGHADKTKVEAVREDFGY